MNIQQMPPPAVHRMVGAGVTTRWGAAVIIPARDESSRIETCLQAMAEAISRSGKTVGVVVCVNDTTDDTADRAAAVLRARALPHLIADLHFMPGTGGVGRVRDIGMTLAQRLAQPPRWLMTTDADSRVCPDWISANLAELRTADVVFGAITPDPDELAQIRGQLSRHDRDEERYAEAATRLVTLLDPLAHDPAPGHLGHSGASIALTAKALARMGGIPWKPLSEDRALALRAEALDLRIRHASTPWVVTSCRLDGRAVGGMATTLQERCSQADPLCDAWLEPAGALVRRYTAKGRLRALWPAPRAVRRMVDQLLGPAPPLCDPDNFETFGAFWQRLEATHPALRRRRLRQSEAARELPLLLALLCQIKGAGLPGTAISARQEPIHALRSQ